MEIEAETRQSPSLDFAEKRHFEILAKEWWDERGKFRALHAFNPARIKFIVEEIERWRGEAAPSRPLAGLTILDIGCGGGILSEPLARLGGEVTGIDPVRGSVEVATAHAVEQGLPVHYRTATAEELARDSVLFDVVIASEVVEHVADTSFFLATCRSLCKTKGLLIISTLNRTYKSYGLAILAAEHVLGLIPRGTHDWKKFLSPAELERALTAAKFQVVRRSGIVFKPVKNVWELSQHDLSVNYILSAEAM